jgi:hypothetical protein
MTDPVVAAVATDVAAFTAVKADAVADVTKAKADVTADVAAVKVDAIGDVAKADSFVATHATALIVASIVALAVFGLLIAIH